EESCLRAPHSWCLRRLTRARSTLTTRRGDVMRAGHGPRILASVTAVAVWVGASGALAAAPVEVDAKIPPYEKTSGISGKLSRVGSDPLTNLMTRGAGACKPLYPNVRIQIEGKGSSTAPPALISGTAQIGPMSRSMKPSEIDEFEKKFGYPPTQVSVAIDALAVYVNKDNPLEKLTLTEVDAIFSKTRACGAPADVSTWGAVGLAR